ncbi:MAG: sialate O-acetylesterase [Clostridium sp.]|nr:sialate O-acetylesterase [Clostridium sp.]
MAKILKTAQIFTDNMVLQRNRNVRVWGEGRENTEITVTINSHKLKTRVVEYKWSVELPRMEAGGPYELRITDGKSEITYKNVMVGEVWLAGGQSNMEVSLENCMNGKQEVRNANCELVRFYNTAKISTLEEESLKEESQSEWRIVSPDTAAHMSAVAYFFAREVSKKLGITIGIIDCYWGGTSISCWMSKEYLEQELCAHVYMREWEEKASQLDLEEYERAVIKFNEEYHQWLEKELILKEENPDITWEETVAKIGNCPWEQPIGYKSPYRPARLYDTMVSRVSPYTVKGFLWYQGESDQEKAEIYDKMLYRLINQWRTDWMDETLPFYIVQLPMWIEKGAQDNKSWAVLREKQRKVAYTLRNTYLTVLIDCGEYDNLHPLDKQTVGHRLALKVLKKTYEYKDLIVDGPRYLQRDLKDGKIILYFAHVYGGFRVIGNDDIRFFEIAGDDKVFVPADAVIVDNTIEVSNKTIKNPKYARYGWTNYGIVNLFNAEGFPLMPFATE